MSLNLKRHKYIQRIYIYIYRERERERERERNLPSLIKRMRWIVFFFLKHSENDKLGKIN